MMREYENWTLLMLLGIMLFTFGMIFVTSSDRSEVRFLPTAIISPAAPEAAIVALLIARSNLSCSSGSRSSTFLR